MARSIVSLAFALAIALLASAASAAIVEHTFDVASVNVTKLCKPVAVPVVNGSLPGPLIQVKEGDTLVVHVNNRSPYNITIHWHGVFQLMSGWADGPEYVAQCPLRTGTTYTYRFNVTGQEGTLWWHAHVSVLRTTIHGGLIIRPRAGRAYPFAKPYREVPIILGEWWDRNPIDIENEALGNGGVAAVSDAYTINGQPGVRYNCSSKNAFKLTVFKGKTYLLRIINAAVNNQLFFKIAGHNFTVVAVDASYTEPYATDIVVIAPGQTADVLFTANQPRGDYYMAANVYSSSVVPFNNTIATGIVHYSGAAGGSSRRPLMPVLPNSTDIVAATVIAHRFYSNLTGLTTSRYWSPPPRQVDEQMLITVGVGPQPCGADENCSASPFGSRYRFSANMNNVSFQLPRRLSMLEAFQFNVSGIYTEDFPDQPPVKYNYTAPVTDLLQPMFFSPKATRAKRLKFNSTVEVVFQNTAVVSTENHPIHIHGFNFHVLAQGFGNYNNQTDRSKYNFVNPQERNTIAVPVGGWAAVRFRANNPGVWFMHCHLDVHVPWGLAGAFVVDNGPTPSTSLPPPPPDLPKC